MKVGVLIDRIFIGGVEKIAIDQVKALKDQGIDAKLLVLSRKYPEPSAFGNELKNIDIEHLEDRIPKILRLDFPIPFFSFFSFFHISYALLLPFYMKKKEYDLIISHNPYTTFSAWTLNKFKNIKYRYYIHDYIGYIFNNVYMHGLKKAMFIALSPLATATDKILINGADLSFTQSQDHLNALSLLIRDSTNIKIITPAKRISSKVMEKQGYFLMATAWKKGKNVETLVKSIKSNSPYRFKLAGKWIHDDYKNEVQKIITDNKLEGIFEIIGEVSEEVLNDLYQNANAVIITSEEKGFGLPAIEASCNGTTFVIPDSCGASQYFSKKDGFIYKYNDMNAVHNALLKLNDSNYAFNMGSQALITSSKVFSWKQHVSMLIGK